MRDSSVPGRLGSPSISVTLGCLARFLCMRPSTLARFLRFVPACAPPHFRPVARWTASRLGRSEPHEGAGQESTCATCGRSWRPGRRCRGLPQRADAGRARAREVRVPDCLCGKYGLVVRADLPESKAIASRFPAGRRERLRRMACCPPIRGRPRDVRLRPDLEDERAEREFQARFPPSWRGSRI